MLGGLWVEISGLLWTEGYRPKTLPVAGRTLAHQGRRDDLTLDDLHNLDVATSEPDALFLGRERL